MPHPSGGRTEERDVVIIGGGIAGTAAAYFLAREGADVLLLERGELNGQASGANAGSIHLQIPVHEFATLGSGWTRRFAPVLTILREGAELWSELAGMLGQEVGFRRTGGVVAAESDEQMERLRKKARLETEFGTEVRLLDREELRSLAPYLSPRMIGGAFCPGEGQANPLAATRAFAASAAARGATLRTGTEVKRIERRQNSYRVFLGQGTVDAGRIVNAAGAEAGTVAAHLGLEFAVQGHPIQVSATEPAGPLVRHLVYAASGRLTLKQMANGVCLIGGGWPSRQHGGTGLSVCPDSLGGNMATACGVVPALARARIVRSWPAIVNGTADWRPILGEVPDCPGFYMNLFPWMGFTAGPISALVVSELILGRPAPICLAGISSLA